MTKIHYLLSLSNDSFAFERSDVDDFVPTLGTRVSIFSSLGHDGVIASSVYSVITHRWECLIRSHYPNDDPWVELLEEAGWTRMRPPD